MLKKLLLTSSFLFIFFITIYPSKKEDTKIMDNCHSLEIIIARNSVEKSKNLSKNYKTFTKEITLFGTNKTKGYLVKKIIDQYKISKKLFIINFLPNQLYCLAGYWTEVFNPGTFISIFYEKSKETINQYDNIKKEAEDLIKEFNSGYEFIRKEIKDFL